MSMTREEASVLLKMMFAFWANTHERTNVEMEMALNLALSALRPVSREQVKKVWPGCPYCKEDGEGYVKKFGAYSIQNGELTTGHCKPQKIKFCPHCSRPLTDEAVEMVMERMEKLHEDNGCS